VITQNNSFLPNRQLNHQQKYTEYITRRKERS